MTTAWTTNVDDVITYINTDLPANHMHVTRTETGLRLVNVANQWVFDAAPEGPDGRWRVKAWNTAGEKQNPKPSWDPMELWSTHTVQKKEATLFAVEVFLADNPPPTIEVLVNWVSIVSKGMVSSIAAENVFQSIILVRSIVFRNSF